MRNLKNINETCPRCSSGIMTPYSTVYEEDGVMKSKRIDNMYTLDNSKPEFILSICSLDICGYTETLATPFALEEHKKERRKQLI